MRRLLRRSDRESAEEVSQERPAEVSPDLAYELQSKLLDQLATVSVAGAGLAITLIGSLLQGAPGSVWISVVFFGLAALTAVGGNVRLIDGIFHRKAVLRRSRLDVQVAMAMIGAAAGFLSMEIYSQSSRSPERAQAAQQATAPASGDASRPRP
ncbi:hypothetical protein VPH46_01895 [Sphingomonas sp. MJ1 (PH-R8)]